MKSKAEHMDLVHLYLSGEATREQVGELEGLMSKDPQLRADFLAYARIDAALPKAIDGERLLIESGRGWLFKTPFVITIGLVSLLILSRLLSTFQESSPVVAKFGELKECRWVSSALDVARGDLIKAGQRIELSSGTAEIQFETGAKLTVVGPAIFEPRSLKGGFLTLGEIFLIADTRESRGFTIETPISKFVDIGTAFTATVSPDGLSRLDVSQGEVDVVLEGAEPLRFREGETGFVEPGAKRIITRIESGAESAAFRFPSIAPPSRDDYADLSQGNATIHVAKGELHSRVSNSGAATVLIDGSGQTKQDAPLQSAFFKTGTSGMFLIDLGKPVAISKINSYSWHQHNKIAEHRERATQRFTLYGYSGDEIPDIENLSQSPQWQRIARVNSDRFFKVNERLDRPAQQACSITAAEGIVGRFRYLLWDVKRNTFYGEFDVFGEP